MGEGCEKCIHYHTKTSEFPCKECNRLFYGMETDHFTENAIDDRPAEDPVNHPKHYADTCSLECIDVMLIAFGKDAVISFCMCNAFKYMWGFKNKNGQEDLQKADWYLRKAEDLGPDDYLHDQILCLCATLGRLRNGKEND